MRCGWSATSRWWTGGRIPRRSAGRWPATRRPTRSAIASCVRASGTGRPSASTPRCSRTCTRSQSSPRCARRPRSRPRQWWPAPCRACRRSPASIRRSTPRSTRVAATYALPRAWRLRRYGVHGLSHAHAARRAGELLDKPVEDLRLVSCHLGAGASLCAIDRGRSVDTTMRFTPARGPGDGDALGQRRAGSPAVAARARASPGRRRRSRAFTRAGPARARRDRRHARSAARWCRSACTPGAHHDPRRPPRPRCA
jgi:hypothetical protein